MAERGRSAGLLALAALSALLACLPAAWLAGAADPARPELAERLADGVLVWRVAWLLLGAFLAAAGWRAPAAPAQAGEAPAPTSASARRWLVALTLIAALVRLPGLNLGLWFDELWMLVEFVRANLGKSPREFPADNHHPLYTILAWLSVRAFGEAPWALRLPAWLAGVAAVPALFALGRRLVGERVTLLACGLLAVSYHHVAFSQNARGYTLLLLCALLASHGFLEALRSDARRAWLLQGAALGLATFAHTTGVFLAVAQLVVWLGAGLPRRRWGPLLGLVLGGLVSLALHALMLPQMLWFFVLREGTVAVDAAWKSPLWTLVEAARSLGLANTPGYAALTLAAGIGVVGVLALARRRPAAAALFLLTPLLVGATMLVLGRNLWPRMFFFCAGFVVLLGALGLETVAAPLVQDVRRRTALLAALVLASGALLPKAWFVPKQDYAGARDWVLAHRGPRDVVLTVGLASFPYEDYYGGEFRPVETAAELEGALAGASAAYVLSTFGVYLQTRQPDVYAFLKEHAREVARFRGSVGDGDVLVLRVPRN